MARGKYDGAYEMGKGDRIRMYAKEANPYKACTPEAQAWLIGWREKDSYLKKLGDTEEPKRTIRS